MSIVQPGAGTSIGRRAQTFGITGLQSGPRQADEDGTGRAEIVLPPVGSGGLLLLQRILVQTDSTGSPTVRMYVGSESPLNMVDGTPSGKLDVAEYTNPLILMAGEQLRIVWSGLSAGARCVARIQAAEAIIQHEVG